MQWYASLGLVAAFAASVGAQASSEPPADLSSNFGGSIDLQTSFGGDASDGFSNGQRFTPEETTQVPAFALGDSSGVNTNLNFLVLMVDTTEENNRVLHYARAGFQASGDKTGIESQTPPAVRYQGPGSFGEQGERQYTFLLYRQRGDFPGQNMPQGGEAFDVKQFQDANNLQDPEAGNVMIVDVNGGGAPPQEQQPAPEPPQEQQPAPEPPQEQQPAPEPPKEQQPAPEPPVVEQPAPEPPKQEPQPIPEPPKEFPAAPAPPKDAQWPKEPPKEWPQKIQWPPKEWPMPPKDKAWPEQPPKQWPQQMAWPPKVNPWPAQPPKQWPQQCMWPPMEVPWAPKEQAWPQEPVKDWPQGMIWPPAPQPWVQKGLAWAKNEEPWPTTPYTQWKTWAPEPTMPWVKTTLEIIHTPKVEAPAVTYAPPPAPAPPAATVPPAAAPPAAAPPVAAPPASPPAAPSSAPIPISNSTSPSLPSEPSGTVSAENSIASAKAAAFSVNSGLTIALGGIAAVLIF